VNADRHDERDTDTDHVDHGHHRRRLNRNVIAS
jgi:hypothetical protein